MKAEEIIKLLQSEEKISDAELSLISDWVEVRKLMRKEVMEEGTAYCPICKKKTTKYSRSVNKGMYFFLLHLSSKWRKGEYVYYDTIKKEVSGKYQVNVTDYSKLSPFGLLEMKQDADDDTGITSGECRITEKGWNWIRGNTSIPKQIYMINNIVVGESDTKVFFNECQQKFRLKDLYQKV